MTDSFERMLIKRDRLLQHVIPAEDGEADGETTANRAGVAYVKRPPFSLPVMTNNFRRFNARCVRTIWRVPNG